MIFKYSFQIICFTSSCSKSTHLCLINIESPIFTFELECDFLTLHGFQKNTAKIMLYFKAHISLTDSNLIKFQKFYFDLIKKYNNKTNCKLILLASLWQRKTKFDVSDQQSVSQKVFLHSTCQMYGCRNYRLLFVSLLGKGLFFITEKYVRRL